MVAKFLRVRHDHDHVIVQLVQPERAGSDVLAPEQVRQRDLAPDGPAFHLGEPCVTKSLHLFTVPARDTGRSPKSEVLWHTLFEIVGRLFEERFPWPLAPVITVMRLLQEAVSLLRVIPEDELVLQKLLTDEADEATVEYMDRPVHP